MPTARMLQARADIHGSGRELAGTVIKTVVVLSSLAMEENEWPPRLSPYRNVRSNFNAMKANATVSVSRLLYAMFEAARTQAAQNDLNRMVYNIEPLRSMHNLSFSRYAITLPAFHIGGALLDALLPQSEENNNWYHNGDLYVNRLHPAQPLQGPEALAALTGMRPFRPEALTTLIPFLSNP